MDTIATPLLSESLVMWNGIVPSSDSPLPDGGALRLGLGDAELCDNSLPNLEAICGFASPTPAPRLVDLEHWETIIQVADLTSKVVDLESEITLLKGDLDHLQVTKEMFQLLAADDGDIKQSLARQIEDLNLDAEGMNHRISHLEDEWAGCLEREGVLERDIVGKDEEIFSLRLQISHYRVQVRALEVCVSQERARPCWW
ncbi:hypothetical protein JAAARDRAFT_200289 [Jaapia argillacea MUCL 33604]|uniref:Uncharacterized protein n=1 Tax=Jaapia argillacea MUCL 33604 TaxID=933084 RepID=A0A067PHV3_9AGAM|nr:hypothetical protein JAAARDRAFT_200289 [Jaapia argillacea MUCL 33604]